MENNLFH